MPENRLWSSFDSVWTQAHSASVHVSCYRSQCYPHSIWKREETEDAMKQIIQLNKENDVYFCRLRDVLHEMDDLVLALTLVSFYA